MNRSPLGLSNEGLWRGVGSFHFSVQQEDSGEQSDVVHEKTDF